MYFALKHIIYIMESVVKIVSPKLSHQLPPLRRYVLIALLNAQLALLSQLAQHVSKVLLFHLKHALQHVPQANLSPLRL